MKHLYIDALYHIYTLRTSLLVVTQKKSSHYFTIFLSPKSSSFTKENYKYPISPFAKKTTYSNFFLQKITLYDLKFMQTTTR